MNGIVDAIVDSPFGPRSLQHCRAVATDNSPAETVLLERKSQRAPD
jgi:hypothetical protein